MTRHVISGIHDAACAKVIRAGAKLVLAPGYAEREEKRKVKEKEDKERAEDKKRKHEYVAQKWDESRDKKYRSEVVELQRGRRRAFREEEPVSLPAELASKPSWQTILQVKDPQDLPEDLVYCLMEGGRLLTILEDIRPIFRTYTSVGGHVCGTHQAESYYRPTIIRKQRAAALRLLNDDVMRGGCLGIVFDETTDCCDRHPVNIIVHTPERVCYTTTAFIGRKEAVNSKTVAKAVMDAWEELGLPRVMSLGVSLSGLGSRGEGPRGRGELSCLCHAE